MWINLLKELKEIFDMYTNASNIFESIFYEFNELFGKEDFVLSDKLETYRILWNFFVDYFIDDSFFISLLIQLKYIFAVYKQDEVVKYIHDLVLVRWNVHDIIENMKKKLVVLIGPEEKIIDEKEKIQNMNNIDALMNYIEGDEKPKKKKKKKKKNNKINMLDELANKYGEQNNIIDDDYDDIEDGLSMISEADSVLNCFKKDIMAETEYNTGGKVVPMLSSEFLVGFRK